MMKHAYGEGVLQLFSTSAVDRMEGCMWDPEKEMVIGLYDDEISYMDEADPMKDMLKPNQTKTDQSNATSTTAPNTEVTGSHTDTFTPPHMFEGPDDDSVSTIGQSIHQRWTPNTKDTVPMTQRQSPTRMRSDEKSSSSISTLTTRLTTMETQYQQISGDVQDIKNLLAVIARTSTNHSNQDEAPTDDTNAGRSAALTGEGS